MKIKRQDVNFSTTKSITIDVDGVQKEAFTFVLTSERIDRDGDVVLQSGINLEGFKSNNVVFFEHDTNKHAIANAYNLRNKGTKTVADVVFHELDEESKQIARYVRAGVYKAGSIGFRVKELKRRPSNQQEKAETGFQYINDLTQTELFEFSIVKIPANIDSQTLKDYKKLYDKENEAKEKGELNEEDNLMKDTVEKAGAVLSKKNKEKLANISALANEILESATSEESKDLTDLQTQVAEQSKTIEELELKVKEMTPTRITIQEYNQLIMESVNG